MPLYDYVCAACRRRFEVIHGVHAEGPTSCPLCGKGPVRKAISAAAVHYKGSGWAKKERRDPVTAGTSKSSDDGSGSDGSKPEASDAGDGKDPKGSGTAAPSNATEAKSDDTGSSRSREARRSKSSASKPTD